MQADFSMEVTSLVKRYKSLLVALKLKASNWDQCELYILFIYSIIGGSVGYTFYLSVYETAISGQ